VHVRADAEEQQRLLWVAVGVACAVGIRALSTRENSIERIRRGVLGGGALQSGPLGSGVIGTRRPRVRAGAASGGTARKRSGKARADEEPRGARGSSSSIK